MKICQIIIDERDMEGMASKSEPFFCSAPEALLEGFARLQDIEVHVVCCSRRNSSAPPKIAGNIFYHQIAHSGGYRRSLFIEAAIKIRKKIHEIDPDLVIGQGTEDYPGVCAAYSGYPNCITLHGNMRAVAKKLNYRPFPYMHLTAVGEYLALKKTNTVICNSAYTEQCVGSLNPNKFRIPNAVCSSFFGIAELRAALAGQSKARSPSCILCVGRVLPYKNQIGLIEALDGLANKCHLRLIFAGGCKSDSVYGHEFFEAIRKRDWCEYAGRLDRQAILGHLKECAGVIHPTLEDSFGLAVAEAQAAGVPVAASAVGGIPDLIQDGETGLLFDPHDSRNICEKTEQMLNPEIGARLGRNAKSHALAEYRPEIIAKKHLDLYEKITRGSFCSMK